MSVPESVQTPPPAALKAEVTKAVVATLVLLSPAVGVVAVTMPPKHAVPSELILVVGIAEVFPTLTFPAVKIVFVEVAGVRTPAAQFQ